MKKFYLPLLALVAAASANAADNIVTLDLTSPIEPMEFDADNGAWTSTYDEETYTIDSQVFTFLHFAMSEYSTWWGATASKSADNSMRDNYMKYQFSNMARGGIVLDENGKVKKDQYGAPVVSADVPYIVAYASSYYSEHPVEMVFNDGKSYIPVGVYVGLTSWPYYSIELGDAFSRAFTEGDKFTLTIHGVAADNSEKSVTVNLASFDNGDITITRGWKYVDLSELGPCESLWFSMKTTDVGTYGDNTPTYFCLDKLMVKPAEDSSVASVEAQGKSIRYDRASATVTLPSSSEFAMVFNAAGSCVMSSDKQVFSIESLPAGVYVVKSGNSRLKIAR